MHTIGHIPARVRTSLAVAVLLLVGLGGLHLIESVAGMSAVAAATRLGPGHASPRLSRPHTGGAVVPSQNTEQADLDLVGASIGAYDR
jgi:hypothetical protein